VPNYLRNLLKLTRSQPVLLPLVAVFHLTGRCNLNCVYCEDYGARRPNDELAQLGVLPLAQAERVLTILRQATPHLILTGGEPLLYPEIDTLVSRAKAGYHFQHVTLLTNGLLLSKHLGLLPHLDQLVISLDSLDVARWGQTIGLNSRAAETIIQTIVEVAEHQADRNFELVVNCVITPETLPDAEAVLDFCLERHIAFAFSPQSFNNWPRYELLVAEAYRAFVDKVIAYKKRGLKIVGSLAYLKLARDFQPYACYYLLPASYFLLKMKLARDFQPYACYPTLVPRVLPNGDLIYPCRPIERSQTAQGGRPCNLTRMASWAEAMRLAVDKFGPPPQTCFSCFQQCYAEPSLMQAQPASFLREMVMFSASRRAKLHIFAPG
jgi:MoaA/NifB/PqqE/SkfB family radical SAM enzyme